jgi:hypothetical protein
MEHLHNGKVYKDLNKREIKKKLNLDYSPGSIVIHFQVEDIQNMELIHNHICLNLNINE